jgi:hypothetical protein
VNIQLFMSDFIVYRTNKYFYVQIGIYIVWLNLAHYGLLTILDDFKSGLINVLAILAAHMLERIKYFLKRKNKNMIALGDLKTQLKNLEIIFVISNSCLSKILKVTFNDLFRYMNNKMNSIRISSQFCCEFFDPAVIFVSLKLFFFMYSRRKLFTYYFSLFTISYYDSAFLSSSLCSD